MVSLVCAGITLLSVISITLPILTYLSPPPPRPVKITSDLHDPNHPHSLSHAPAPTHCPHYSLSEFADTDLVALLDEEYHQDNPLKILVTGASTLVGAHLCEFLSRSLSDSSSSSFSSSSSSSFISVVCVDEILKLQASRLVKYLQLDSKSERRRMVSGSMSDEIFLEKLFSEYGPFHTIYHANVFSTPSLSHYSPTSVYSKQLVESVALLNYAQLTKVKRFVYLSSLSVYGNSPFNPPPFVESGAVHPMDPLSIAHYSFELDLKAAAHVWGQDFVVFRIGNVFGKGEFITKKWMNSPASMTTANEPESTDADLEKGFGGHTRHVTQKKDSYSLGYPSSVRILSAPSLPTLFLHQALNNEPFTLFGTGDESRRSYTYVTDLIPIIALLPFMKESKNEVYNLNALDTWTPRELALQIAMLLSQKFQAESSGTPSSDPSKEDNKPVFDFLYLPSKLEHTHIEGDSTKLSCLIDMPRFHDLTYALHEMIDWMEIDLTNEKTYEAGSGIETVKEMERNDANYIEILSRFPKVWQHRTMKAVAKAKLEKIPQNDLSLATITAQFNGSVLSVPPSPSSSAAPPKAPATASVKKTSKPGEIRQYSPPTDSSKKVVVYEYPSLARKPTDLEEGERRTFVDQMAIGLWISEATMDRVPPIQRTWYKRGPVYFIATRPNSRNVPVIMLDGVNRDDYISHIAKGFLGLKKMYEQHPTRDWYVIGGDDNYFHFGNLARVLSEYDFNKELAVSQISPHGWATGGAGIATSQAFTKRAAAGPLEEFYKRNPGGDPYLGKHDVMFTGLVKEEMKLPMTHTHGMYSQPPARYLVDDFHATQTAGGLGLRLSGSFHYIGNKQGEYTWPGETAMLSLDYLFYSVNVAEPLPDPTDDTHFIHPPLTSPAEIIYKNPYDAYDPIRKMNRTHYLGENRVWPVGRTLAAPRPNSLLVTVSDAVDISDAQNTFANRVDVMFSNIRPENTMELFKKVWARDNRRDYYLFINRHTYFIAENLLHRVLYSDIYPPSALSCYGACLNQDGKLIVNIDAGVLISNRLLKKIVVGDNDSGSGAEAVGANADNTFSKVNGVEYRTDNDRVNRQGEAHGFFNEAPPLERNIKDQTHVINYPMTMKMKTAGDFIVYDYIIYGTRFIGAKRQPKLPPRILEML